MSSFLLSIALLGLIGFGVYYAVGRLSGGDKRKIIDAVNGIFDWSERKGLHARAPAFRTDYGKDYPELRLLEENHSIVRDECMKLLGIKERIVDVESLGGSYTDGGIHAAKWKSFMFKSGEFIPENCALAPETTRIIERIPGVYTAFFSILEPHQYITPHFGYYKGFLRYHLGVSIPNDNADELCWLRVNASREDNDRRDKSAEMVARGEKYYWRNGEGVIFDDTFLHDASNESDEVRVVLWLDVRRKLPFYLHWFNTLVLWIAHRESSVKKIRENARILSPDANG